MKSLSSVGLGLSVVFGCLFLALVAELYYLLWWKKRFANGRIENDYSSPARELFYMFCWKKSTSLRHTALDPQELRASVGIAGTLVHEPEAQLHMQSNKDFWLKPFGEDDIETEFMRLENLSGPPRFLFTIIEETREDLESEDAKSKGDKSGKNSRSRSLSDLILTVETPYLTPLASPSFFTPPLTPQKQNGFNPLFESATDAEFNRMKSSPPPKFKFLQDAEEKLERKLMEAAQEKVHIGDELVQENINKDSHPKFHKDEEDGPFITIIVDRNKERELINHHLPQYHSCTSQSILASNWQGHLNTIKADAKGSKEDIYTSKVKYILKRGKPYIWVPEKDLHNVNTIIDERGSFAVTSPFPGPLASLLRLAKKIPARVALTGDVEPLKDGKAQSAAESLRGVILSEQKAISKCSYTVSGVLSSSDLSCTSRSESLKELLEGDEKYVVYKFNLRSSMFIDGNGGTYEVDLEDIESSKADPLAPFSAKLIDGINQNEARRRALMLFCFEFLNANARDAYMLSIDRKGFDVLGKVPSPLLKDGSSQYQWKEFRFTLKEEASDVENFCHQLVEMEEEAVKKISGYSGLK